MWSLRPSISDAYTVAGHGCVCNICSHIHQKAKHSFSPAVSSDPGNSSNVFESFYSNSLPSRRIWDELLPRLPDFSSAEPKLRQACWEKKTKTNKWYIHTHTCVKCTYMILKLYWKGLWTDWSNILTLLDLFLQTVAYECCSCAHNLRAWASFQRCLGCLGRAALRSDRRTDSKEHLELKTWWNLTINLNFSRVESTRIKHLFFSFSLLVREDNSV